MIYPTILHIARIQFLSASHWKVLPTWLNLNEFKFKSDETFLENNHNYMMGETENIFKIHKAGVENQLHQYGQFDIYLPDR